jgi:demethylmenaquinone methyltransferase/2-methoxy-6-polyprenyl-1,4-benzoquinol methylase
MFDRIADRYDLVNDVLSLGQDRGWRRATIDALRIEPGDRVLDVAAGTGTSAVALQRAGADVTACDISIGMAEVAKNRYPDLRYVVADALELPFEADSFDAVTMSFGLRNVPDVDRCLRELGRVTRPGGRLVICEFSTPTSGLVRAAYRTYLTKALPRIGGLLSGDRASYEYLATTVAQWPSQLGLAQKIRAAGWHRVGYRNLSGGLVALHRAVAGPSGANPDKFVP